MACSRSHQFFLAGCVDGTLVIMLVCADLLVIACRKNRKRGRKKGRKEKTALLLANIYKKFNNKLVQYHDQTTAQYARQYMQAQAHF